MSVQLVSGVGVARYLEYSVANVVAQFHTFGDDEFLSIEDTQSLDSRIAVLEYPHHLLETCYFDFTWSSCIIDGGCVYDLIRAVWPQRQLQHARR